LVARPRRINKLTLFNGPQGDTDGFVTELSSNGSALVYSTFLGGESHDQGGRIAVDGASV